MCSFTREAFAKYLRPDSKHLINKLVEEHSVEDIYAYSGERSYYKYKMYRKCSSKECRHYVILSHKCKKWGSLHLSKFLDQYTKTTKNSSK